MVVTQAKALDKHNGEESWGWTVVSGFWRFLFLALSLALIQGIHNFVIANSAWIEGILRVLGTE